MLKNVLLASLGGIALSIVAPQTENSVNVNDIALAIPLENSEFPITTEDKYEEALIYDSFDSGLGFEDTVEFFTYDDNWEPVRVLSDWDNKQIKCLADNLYHEARGEPREGQIAVVDVVFNRVDDPRWPDTPCKVIYQRAQFSWTLGRRPPVLNRELYTELYNLAEHLYINPDEADITGNAQYYHATYVRPHWASAFNRTRRIDMHIFYRQN